MNALIEITICKSFQKRYYLTNFVLLSWMPLFYKQYTQPEVRDKKTFYSRCLRVREDTETLAHLLPEFYEFFLEQH